MAVNAAYQLSYTGEQVEDLLGQVTVNKDNIAQINTDLGGKVDKVAGKGLSENDFTTADKNKLSGIAAGAEVNVNADWDAISGDAQILNKPTIPSKTSQLTNDSGYITDAGVTSFNGQTGAVTYTPPAETDPVFKASPAYGISSSDISSWNAKQDTIDDLTVIRQGAAAGATAYQKPSGGIPKSDLSSSVQTSLDKADSAIQTETDPVFSASPAAGITSSDISSWNAKQSALTFDTTPTANSTNPVTSAGIKAYVDNATPTITMDDIPTSGSNNPVKSGGIYTALQGKQNTLTFDSTPTASSTNPVTSGGVKTALDLKANQSTTYTKTEVDALFDDVAYLGDDDGTATTLDFDPQADTVWNIPQTLGSSQQAQARANIGVVDVSGTNDGTNWTSITIGSTTKAIPSGGSSGDVNVIESITFNGTAATIDSTTKNAAISYTPPVTSVNNQTGAVSLTLGDVNTIETVKVNGTALTPDANKAVDVPAVTSFNGSTGAVTYTAPVTSVNGNTGAVSLALGDTNVIETVKVNGTALTPTNKAVDISVPSAVTESTVSGWGFTKNTGNVSSTTITTIVSLTEAQYTNLSTKDSATLYVIIES